jgi:hypothetical protein
MAVADRRRRWRYRGNVRVPFHREKVASAEVRRVVGDGLCWSCRSWETELITSWRRISLPAPWWLIVIVAAIAPSVLATMVHLAGLLVRYIDVVSVGEPSSEADEDLEELTKADQGPATFEEMMLAGWGYARVASALGIEKNEARKRVYAHRKSLEVQTEDAPDFERETEGAVS